MIGAVLPTRPIARSFPNGEAWIQGQGTRGAPLPRRWRQGRGYAWGTAPAARYPGPGLGFALAFLSAGAAAVLALRLEGRAEAREATPGWSLDPAARRRVEALRAAARLAWARAGGAA